MEQMASRNIEKPEDFIKLWDAYKITIDENPDKEQVVSMGEVIELKRNKPYTRQGFEVYVYRREGFHIHQYIDNYQNQYEDFLGVVTCVRREWENDQISGSLTGRYKAPNLVARLNGLVDKKETEIKGGLNVPNLPDIGKRK